MPRLLIVDDEPPVLNILNDMLSFAGHDVVAVQDGQEALRLIEKGGFDLVITDLVMPDVSGWDIAGKVKSTTPHVPVILLTGWAEHHKREDLSQRGVDLLLAKPVTLKTLTGAIDKLTSCSLENSL